MIDQSTIDLVALIGQHTTLRKIGADWRGPCPLHDGHNRTALRVRKLPNGAWRWRCYAGCGGGDAIAFVQQRFGVDFPEALRLLQIDAGTKSSARSKRPRAPVAPPTTDPPPESWQAAALAFVAESEARLWSSAGQEVRFELQARGLTEATIKHARLGLNPRDFFVSKDAFGLLTRERDIWLPRGTVIPWFVEGAIWKVSIRRPNGLWCVADPDDAPPEHHPQAPVWTALRTRWQGLAASDLARLLAQSEQEITQALSLLSETGSIVPAHKYHHLPGGSNALYHADLLRPGRPVMLCEGTLDALAVQQEAGDLVTAVASGTTGAQTIRWLIRLLLAQPRLISFDNDLAGARATTYWQHALRPAVVWRAYDDDPAKMLQEGWDLRAWVRDGLVRALGDAVPARLSDDGSVVTAKNEAQCLDMPADERSDLTTAPALIDRRDLLSRVRGLASALAYLTGDRSYVLESYDRLSEAQLLRRCDDLQATLAVGGLASWQVGRSGD